MEFKTACHKETYERTRDYLQSLFGEVNCQSIGDSFVLQEGSTFVYVRVLPVGDSKSVVEVFSYVAVELTPGEELMRFLLSQNLKLILGAFGLAIDDDGTASVILSHSILGKSMDKEELYGSVSAVARVADELDDQIVANFGGKTALDRLMSREKAPAEFWE
ncbi:MAG TPA: YbjN domain-containing protein [Blastocatellia bacterium]|nr:YbjN domain-containing protein [Blastocatellia bacterium]